MVWTPLITFGQGMPMWWWQQHLPSLVFVFCFGACVGSFINVVNYRLPAGMSILSPPSKCPKCGAKLKFFRENLPILGWFILRGKCRYCKSPISPEYMIVETLMALLFVALYYLAYMINPSTPWWSEIFDRWWESNEFVRTFPAFFALAFLIAALVSMTMIDARTYTIPLPIPLFVTVSAFIFYAVQAFIPSRVPTGWPIQAADWQCFSISTGGMIGVVFAVIMLKLGKLKYSFADYHEYLPGEQGPVPNHVTPFELIFGLPILAGAAGWMFGGVWVAVVCVVVSIALGMVIARKSGVRLASHDEDNAANVLAQDYPHARREMLVELKFLIPVMLGLVGGWVVGEFLPQSAPPVVVQALGGSFAGYLMGGGLIWAIRILGTLAFGREAMGLGDVHMLAAVGAVMGWVSPIFIFFLAPFSGISWVLVSKGIGAIIRRSMRELPYGPHLAVATVLLILLWPGVKWAWSVYMGGVPLPAPGLIP